MLSEWTDTDLIRVATEVDHALSLYNELLQAKRRERGAWIRPGLAGTTERLEKLLLASYAKLGRDIMSSLHGASDEIVSGRLGQAGKVTQPRYEVKDSLAYFDIPEDAEDQPVDRSRLDAIALLLGIWVVRHKNIADTVAREVFDQSRVRAIKEAGRTAVAETQVSQTLRNSILDRYEGDIDRLRDGLENGTHRSSGIREIIATAANLGAVAIALRQLLEVEAFRVSMLTESLTWAAAQDGYRAGAVEVTRDILRQNGVHLDEELDVSKLTEAELEGVPQYEFTGPDDSRTCDPCRAQLDDPYIYAVDISDLPSTFEICAYGLACRHDWQLVR